MMMMMMMILGRCIRSARADEADAFPKIGNIFRQKLPQTNKGASGIYGNRNKTDFSSPVKFVLLSLPLAEFFALFVVSDSFVVSGQIPFDVCPFRRKCEIKGRASWIKANLLLPDFATTGDSAILVHNHTDHRPTKDFSFFFLGVISITPVMEIVR